MATTPATTARSDEQKVLRLRLLAQIVKSEALRRDQRKARPT